MAGTYIHRTAIVTGIRNKPLSNMWEYNVRCTIDNDNFFLNIKCRDYEEFMSLLRKECVRRIQGDDLDLSVELLINDYIYSLVDISSGCVLAHKKITGSQLRTLLTEGYKVENVVIYTDKS